MKIDPVVDEALSEWERHHVAVVRTLVNQRDALLAALRKVRGHTSYVNPTLELLQGLLQSIERIADAALDESDRNG